MMANPPTLRERFRLYAPWERAVERVMTPFEEFLHRQTASGRWLLLVTAITLVLANTPWYGWLAGLLHAHLAIGPGEWRLDLPVHHWINDGLMALFFFLVGLEIKREFIAGELADWRNAILPIVAAIGGMVVPALLYLAINAGGPFAHAWGIPMATDIAFAVGVLAALGGLVPKSLAIFLVTLAIVDDLGAVAVIAIAYTDTIATRPLLVAGAMLALAIGFNRAGVQRAFPYVMVGVVMWVAMLSSGVHATVAGVLTAFAIPARMRFDPRHFGEQLRTMADEYERAPPGGTDALNENQKGIVQRVANTAEAMQPLLHRMEHDLNAPVGLFVLPIFALANAGIALDAAMLHDAMGSPVTHGVALGLVAGKVIGISLFSWIAVRLGIARFPRDAGIGHVVGIGLLGGIGFTMSLFIAGLAFPGAPVEATHAKVGILAGSVLSGVAGFVVLYVLGRQRLHSGEPP